VNFIQAILGVRLLNGDHGSPLPVPFRTTGGYKLFFATVTWEEGNGLAPREPRFNSRWYPYESLVAAGRASG